MSLDFSLAKCQTRTNKKLFGLCDDPAPSTIPAYVDELNGAKWIAVVQNDYSYDVLFTAVDHCIEVPEKEDGKPSKRCDGMLTYNDSVIFVELKERAQFGSDWMIDSEKQLKATISHFETTDLSQDFSDKRAYAANNAHPKSKQSYQIRMERFLDETGYVLRIENRLVLV